MGLFLTIVWLFQKNAAAIKTAQQLGVHFVVSSGRGYTEIKPLIEEAGFNCPMITLNGAQVFDETGKLISSSPINDTLSSNVLHVLKKKGLYFEIVTSAGIYSDSKTNRIENFAELLTNVSPETPYKLAVSMAAARFELMNINYTDDYLNIIEDPALKIYKFVTFSNKGASDLDPIREELKNLTH